MSDFEKKVKKSLIDKDMTIGELCEELHITRSYLFEIMKGTRKAEAKKQEIIDFLGLKEDEES